MCTLSLTQDGTTFKDWSSQLIVHNVW